MSSSTESAQSCLPKVPSQPCQPMSGFVFPKRTFGKKKSSENSVSRIGLRSVNGCTIPVRMMSSSATCVCGSVAVEEDQVAERGPFLCIKGVFHLEGSHGGIQIS